MAVGQQAAFPHYQKFAKRTNVQGQCDLAGAGDVAIGVFVDCSAKGDSVTIETGGFEFVKMASVTGVGIGDRVTPGADGLAVKIAGYAATPATIVPTLAELIAGVFEVDQIDAANLSVLIDLDRRL
jgi:hypothetical protein